MSVVIEEPTAEPLSLRRIATTWWPLAASWLLMGVEGPAISAVVARLIDPKINLAAYGGVVFPLALLIESPVVMLLAASTALSKDLPSYRRLRTFMHGLSALLTLAHVVIAFTPLSYVVVRDIIGAPPEVVAPARLGLMIMVPWTWAIAYRRFNQGVLIRYGHSLAVGVGTLVRLSADGLVLLVGYMLGSVPGIIVAVLAIDVGVLSEAIYARLRVRPVVRERLKVKSDGPRLGFRAFLAFYLPLSLTSVISLMTSPVGSAALSRMPSALESLAVWPVATGVSFLFRSFGFAYNEVVVALIEEPGAAPRLRRFTLLIAVATTLALTILLIPPVGSFLFLTVFGLPLNLADLARASVWLALPMPALSVLQSWYQGIILNSRRTRVISEAVILSLAVIVALLGTGVVHGGVTGLYVGVGALTAGELLRTFWLWWRSRGVRAHLYLRDAPLVTPPASDARPPGAQPVG